MIEDVYSLSPLQEGLYYHWLSAPDASAYFQQMSYRVKGNLNVSALEKSYALLVARHSVLRTVFTQKVGEKLLQVVKKESSSNFDYVRIKNEKNDVEEYKRADRSKGFDLGSGSQMRLSVLDLGNHVYEFIWSFHHILMDGWCIGILIKEFFEIYESCLQNKDPQLSKVYPYSTYIKWLEAIDKTQSLQYWKNYLNGYDTVSSLPKTALNADQYYVTEETTLSISGEIRTSIKKQCAALGITENTFIQTIWGILLSKYNNTNDVVFGAVVSGRPAEIEGIEEMIGLFINTIPVRIQMNDTITVSELLKQVQKLSNEGIKHHYTQLAEIQSESELGRDLFDHIMVFENYPVQEMVQQTINNQDNEHQFTLITADAFEQTNYNLTLVVIPGDVLMIKCRYNPTVYDTLYIQQVQKHIETIITQVIQHSEQYIHQIEYLGISEKQQLLEALNNTNIDYPKNKTITMLFEEQVAKTPNNTAVIFEDNILTYQQLNEKSNQLADYLRTNYHIQPDDLIALQLPRNEWMVITILATLKAGAAYVPIDPEYPQERIDYTISDSQCKVVIDEKELEKFKQEENKYAKHNVQHIHQPNNLAYVIYTSGTTGKPKGTLIEHRNVVRLFKNEKPLFDFTPNDVWTMFHSYCFDFSVWEMYGALLFGGKLVVIPSLTAKDPEAYLHILRTQKVTLLNQTPSSFYNLIKHELAQQTTALQLRYIIFGGEALSPGKLKSWKQKYPTTQLINMYGITETTVHVTYKEITDNEIGNNISNIGKPIPTLSCYILDKHQNLLPIGVAGELYVGGAGVARGYLNRKELTAEKFILNPYKKEERLYRSGDKAKRLINGELEYLGRIDEQVKIRGYRIELGEIEAALQKHPHIQTTVVIAKANEEGEKELVAYIVSKQELNATDVRSYLSQHLPAYLIPTHYVQLQQIPLTSNGKLDKKALPDPATWGLRTGAQYIAPRNETEEKLTALWQKILAKETIGVHDNFFELGGHSLKLTRLAAQIHKLFEIQIELKELFVHTTIEAQAQYITQTQKKGYTAIPLAPQQNDYPLSSSQRRLWVLSQFEESNSAYNMPGVYVLEGSLNIEALQYAFNTVVERHESLRTFFVENEQQEIKQIIQPYHETISKIFYQDLRSTADQPQTIREIIHQNCIAPFDLRTAPLIRTALYQTKNNQWILVYVMHHIISDGWSMEVLINEVLTIYNAYIKKEKNPLVPLHIQYKDYAVWQQQLLHEPALQSHKQYWLQQFQGELPVLSLLTDKPRPAVKTYNGASVQKIIHTDLFKRLQTFNQQQGCTLFMSLVAAVNTLLYRYTQQEDIIIGSVVAGREHADLENQIGFYVNTIALRTLFKGKNSFQELVQNIKQTTLQSYEHQLFPFDELVDALHLKHDTSRNPLFDIMVVLQNTETDHTSTRQPIDGLTIHNYEDENRVTKFDISFNFAEIQNQLYVHVEYNTDIYEEHTVVQLTNHLESLLQAALQQPTTSIQSLKYLSHNEEALFKAFNKVEPYFSLDKNIIEHIESKALSQPHKTAMQFNEQLIDYGTLNGVANQLAHYLVEKHSTGKDILIGVMMHRSITMAESILGIWKTGSAYVPLDTDYPVERIQQMVEAGQIKALIVDQTVSAQQIELLQLHIPVIHIDEIRSYLKKLPTHNLNKTIDANDLAYVIYTSGSTGQPKGVMIEHLGMMNHIGAKIVEMQISEDSKLAQNAPHTFDISVWQLFAGLVAGGTTVIYSSEIILDPNRFIQQLHVDGITVLELVPSYFVEMLSVLEEQKDALTLSDLKILILNAETLMPSMVKRWLTLYPNIPIVNTYGATETSDDTSHYIMHSLPDTSTVPVMQKPIQYFEVHLVDEQLQRVPIGAIGEVLLCGIAVGRGYLNDEAKTKKSFLTGPLPGITETKRIYRTGDLARYLPDGRMEFLGRKDTQVKIRGHRIELGEIEHALMEIVEIENTTVLANVEEQYLAAYYQSEKELAREDIIELLKKKLPSYMLPHYYIRMEQFPLSANGKIDKKQLPKPETLGLATGDNYIAPTNETEKHVVAVYEEVLKRKPIGIKDDFFALGGDSIKSIQVVSRLKQRGLSITIRDILTSPVVKDLATKVKTNSRHIAQNIVEGLIPLSPVQQYFFEQNDVDNHHYNQSVLLQSKKPILEKDLKAALDKLVLHHDALRMVYKKIDNVWMQENKGATQSYHLEILDVQDEENFQAHCNRIQSSIDLQHGPLLKIALFKNPEQADRLLIVCHHLVIDGVSWRILLEDLSTLYQQSLLHQPLTLPLKTDSFQYWLQKQIEYANSNTLEKEENYWSTLAQQPIDLLPIDNTQGANTVHDTAEETFIVDENTTQQLLTQSYKAYQTDINDVLITALSLAIHQTFNIKHIAITLEGHGREQIVDDIDISRTVGWFTSLYPVVINVQHHHTLIRHAIEVKEVLHRIPNKGVGYGILRYLAKKTYTLQPQIIFNYLGNIEASVTNTEGHQMFEFLGEAHGREISINRKRNHILDISGITVDNQLRLSISYSSQQYNTSTIKRLVDAYQQQLTKLIQQLAAEHTTHITPVDLTYKALTIDQVQQLNFNQNLEDVYPASPLQEGLYYHWFTHPDSLAYFDQISYQVQGHLDMDRIEKSYQQLNDRHAILRTYFTQALSEQLLQVVQKKSDHNFSYIDATKQTSFIRDQYKKEDIAKGFDLHKGSQMRLALIKLDNTHYEFIWSFHHILMDGWCVGILIKEFFEIYESLLKDQQPELPKVHSYANYIQWLNTIDQEESYTYWKNYLQDYDAVSSLYPAPLNQPSNYTIQSKTIHTTEAIRQSIKTLCNTLAITENTFIQTAWGILLSKYNNTNDVVFGSVVSGRPAEIEGIEEMIGLFINTIPIRVQLPEQISVADILKKIQQQSAEATKYHYTQLAEVQSQSELGNRLFDHIMVFENYPVQDMIAQNMRSKQNEEVDILSSDVFEQTGYPLTLTVHPDEKDIQVRFSYNAALYTEEQIDQAQQHFIRIIETIVHNPQQHINEIDCLGDKEKQQLLVDFNDTEVEYDKDKTIIDLFEEQVIKTPNTIAILFENKTLTYKQLQAQSDFLAMYLQHSFNIKAGDFVALQLERNEWTIISILAVLKLGAAYVPMDPEFPQERINYIINDSQCKLIIDETLLNNYQQTKQTLPDKKIHANALQSNHYCAVIYTSGSTGKPKGVPITHLNLHNRLQWMWSTFPFEQQEVCVAKTSLSFVDHLWEIFGPLLQGIKLVMLTKNAVLNINSFIEALFQQKVSRIVLVPSLLKAILLNEQLCVEKLQALKIWSCSGEALEVELIKQFYQIFPNHTLLNIYGSTEVMADVTFYDTSLQKITTEIIIGKPIANTTIYILDQYNNLLPIGISGEIGVSGDGVTTGYLNQSTLTQEKFIANPFKSNTNMYKTGDIGRWLPNGNIEYIGRKDHQIKIRGYRVEIGEIETALQKYPAIDKAVVVVKNTAGENELAAYIISQQKLSNSDIRTYLKTILPSYMVPAYFIQLEKLPLTYSGKIDKKNLPDPQTAAIAQTDMAAYVAPKNELQKKLVLAWQAVLGKEKISIHDNFFELGGNSLRAMKLQTLLHKKYELNITIQDIYNKPTVEMLSLLQSNSDRIILLHAKNATAKTNIYFVPPIVGTPIGYKPLAEKLATHYNSYGLQYRGLGEHDELYPSIQAIALDLSEQILLQQTSAECIIVGYSFGAIIAFEMTKILEAKGKNIQLILVDMKPEKHKQHWLTNIGLALQREWFVLQCRYTILRKNLYTKKIRKFLLNNFSLLDHYTFNGKVKANVHAFEALSNNVKTNMHGWQQYTDGNVTVHYIPGKHEQAFSFDNIAIIEKIIKQLNASTLDL